MVLSAATSSGHRDLAGDGLLHQVLHRGVHHVQQRRRPDAQQQHRQPRARRAPGTRARSDPAVAATLSLATGPKITRLTSHRL